MNTDYFSSLVDHLESLDIFSSIYEIRLLAALISSSTHLTAKDLSNLLSIPDSKVYPHLAELEELDLIEVNETVRPKKYLFSKPELLQSFLKDRVARSYEEKQELIQQIAQISKQIWEPQEFMLDNVALLFRGKELSDEMARHLKLAKSHLFIFLSTEFSNYQLLQTYLPEVCHNDFRLELVVPDGHTDFLTFLDESLQGKIRLRTSIWNQNSYIIRDNSVMLNIFHSDTNVGLLTNDELMVKNVKNCWNDPACCVDTDVIDLELPDSFDFTTIQLR